MLVVDDAVVVRKVLTDVLAADPDIEVAGTASNGKLALQKLPQLNPDVVVLDIEMPEMDGLATLAEIRKTNRRLPIIMFSTLTERGAAATLEALSLGASDYVTKPTNTGSIAGAVDMLKAELLPRIKNLCRRGFATADAPVPRLGARPPRAQAAPGRLADAMRPAPSTPPSARPVRPTGVPGKVDIVAIGVSTGGPNALAEVLPQLPGQLGVPVVIVQHMPPTFTRLLAERLDRLSGLAVREARAGEVLRPGECWIAPGDFHMVLKRRGADVVIDLNQGPPENSCRPAVDVLFRSVADLYTNHCLGVVMTGMGQDGFRGTEHLVEAGSRVVVQDEATSVVWGMPGFIARAGLADAVLPLGGLGAEIVRRVGRTGPDAQRRDQLGAVVGGSRR